MLTPVEIIPQGTILPTDLPGDDPQADRDLEDVLEFLSNLSSPPIDIEAVKVE